MADGTVGWHFFDAESGLVPEELSPSNLPDGGEGRIVVLATTPFAQADGWASRAAVALAQNWALGDLRIFLMDLGLDAPSLHQVLGLPNREGVSDAFLYGASVQRIAQPALDGAIFFAAAGTATTEPAEILGHPRWKDLAGGFSEADATLLLFLPTNMPGADKILGRATDILFFAGQEEPAELHLGPATEKVVAAVGPDLVISGKPPEIVLDQPPEVEETEGSGEVEAEVAETESSEEVDDGDAEVHEPGSDDPDLEGEPVVEQEVEPAVEEESPASSPGQDLFAGQGLSIAEGFVDEIRKGAAEVADLDEPAGPDEPAGDPSLSDLELEGSWASDDPESGVPDPGVGGSGYIPESGEGEEPSSWSADAESSSDGLDFGEGGGASSDVPDFSPDFAEMPGIEEGIGGGVADDFLGDDLVQGSGVESDGSPHRETRGGAHEVADDRKDEEPLDRGRPMGPRPPDGPRRKLKREPPPRKGFTAPRRWLVLALLAVAIVVAGTARGLLKLPGLTWFLDPFSDAPELELEREGLVPVDPVLRLSLEIRTYDADDLDVALELRNTLRGRLPRLIFHLTPAGSRRVESYTLSAGPGADTVGIENVRRTIGNVLTRQDPEAWQVRETPRGFHLGDRGTLREARDYLTSLEADGIPGYIVRVWYPDGSGGYEILSGAFDAVGNARVWQLFLVEKGYADAPLVLRRGRPPA